jgi:hypothetical protein
VSGPKYRCELVALFWVPAGRVTAVLPLELPFRPAAGDLIDGVEVAQADWSTARSVWRLTTKRGAVQPLEAAQVAAMAARGWVMTPESARPQTQPTTPAADG